MDPILSLIQDGPDIPAEPEAHNMCLDTNPEQRIEKQRCTPDTWQQDTTQATDISAEDYQRLEPKWLRMSVVESSDIAEFPSEF